MTPGDKLTEAQLNRLCRVWQRRCPALFGGWTVAVRVCGVPTSADACVKKYPDRDHAEIHISPRATEDREVLLLHELAHLNLDPLWESDKEEDRELLVWLVARALQSLRPSRVGRTKQMPKRFDNLRKQGAKVRTVTKGPNKGRLIAVKGRGKSAKVALGHKRGK